MLRICVWLLGMTFLLPALGADLMLNRPRGDYGVVGRPKVDPKYAPATSWQQAWDESWAHAQRYYRFRPAASLRGDPACTGSHQIPDTVRSTIEAVQTRRYGDAVRHSGTFVDRLHCLPREGVRGVEFALTTLMHRALTELPPDQARVAIHGALNLGLLTFDQLQYTKASWWLPFVYHQHARLAPFLRDYPQELGLLTYDFQRGLVVQLPGMDRALAAMQKPERFGDGSCTLLEMSRNNYDCLRGGGGGGRMSGGGKDGLPGGMDLPAGTATCSIEAARTSGSRGMLGCMQKATAGMTFDPRTMNPQALLSPQPGIRDPRCALSEEAGGGKESTDPPPTPPKNEPSGLEKFVSAAWEVVKAFFDKTPDPLPSADLASEQGANAARNALIGLKENENKQNLLSDDGYETYLKNKENAPAPADFEGRRGPDVEGPLGGTGGGGCGNGSNAAARAQALYRCTSGEGGKPPRNPRDTGPISRTAEPDYTPTGAMACLMQGGDLMRAGFNDPRCQTMRCAEGATCPCNRAPGGGNSLPGSGVATNPNDMNPVINCSGVQSRQGATLSGGGGAMGDPCGTLGVGGAPGGTRTGGGGGPTQLPRDGGGVAPGGVPLSGGTTVPRSPTTVAPSGNTLGDGLRPPAPGSRGAFDELDRETQRLPPR